MLYVKTVAFIQCRNYNLWVYFIYIIRVWKVMIYSPLGIDLYNHQNIVFKTYPFNRCSNSNVENETQQSHHLG